MNQSLSYLDDGIITLSSEDDETIGRVWFNSSSVCGNEVNTMSVNANLRGEQSSCMCKAEARLGACINFNHGRLTTMAIATGRGTKLSGPILLVEAVLASGWRCVLSGTLHVLEGGFSKKVGDLSLVMLIDTLAIDNEGLE